MTLNFLSGLLLTTAVLAIAAYVIKEMVVDRLGDVKNIRTYFSGILERYLRSEAKPVNDHLIGSIGKVVAHSDDSARPMKVRLGMELWPARLNSTGQLGVDTVVKVAAVDGPVLVVEARVEGRDTAHS